MHPSTITLSDYTYAEVLLFISLVPWIHNVQGWIDKVRETTNYHLETKLIGYEYQHIQNTTRDLDFSSSIRYGDKIKKKSNYIDPSASCIITSITAGAQTSCEASSNTYTQQIKVYFSDQPSSGSLIINEKMFEIGSSPRTITLTRLPAEGDWIDVTARFSDDQYCTFTVLALFIAPPACDSTSNQVTTCDNYEVKGIDLTGIYSSDNELASSGTIPSGNTVIFQANNGVYLDKNFNVQHNASLAISIEECTND